MSCRNEVMGDITGILGAVDVGAACQAPGRAAGGVRDASAAPLGSAASSGSCRGAGGASQPWEG